MAPNAPLPYGRHLIEDDDIAAVSDVLRGDWLTTGPAVRRFEEALAHRLEAKYAVVCSSGTAALHLANLVLGLGTGDTVLVPGITFAATANAARYVGADVEFVDVDADNALMRPADLSQALARPRAGAARAVFPVHMAGHCVDMPAIARLAAERDLYVVEDGCHAIGGAYDDGSGVEAKIGSCRHSAMTVFSFHPVKTIAMGEGGAITTNDLDLYEKLVLYRQHGITRNTESFENKTMAFDPSGTPNPWHHEMKVLGYNYRSSDMHCALGLSQLGKLDRFVARRRELAAKYDAALTPLAPLLRPVARPKYSHSALHLYVVLIDFEALRRTRADVMRQLSDDGVSTQVHYIPVNRQPYYLGLGLGQELPGCDRYFQRALSVPLFPGMTDSDAERVVEALKKVVLQ